MPARPSRCRHQIGVARFILRPMMARSQLLPARSLRTRERPPADWHSCGRMPISIQGGGCLSTPRGPCFRSTQCGNPRRLSRRHENRFYRLQEKVPNNRTALHRPSSACGWRWRAVRQFFQKLASVARRTYLTPFGSSSCRKVVNQLGWRRHRGLSRLYRRHGSCRSRSIGYAGRRPWSSLMSAHRQSARRRVHRAPPSGQPATMLQTIMQASRSRCPLELYRIAPGGSSGQRTLASHRPTSSDGAPRDGLRQLSVNAKPRCPAPPATNPRSDGRASLRDHIGDDRKFASSCRKLVWRRCLRFAVDSGHDRRSRSGPLFVENSEPYIRNVFECCSLPISSSRTLGCGRLSRSFSGV